MLFRYTGQGFAVRFHGELPRIREIMNVADIDPGHRVLGGPAGATGCYPEPGAILTPRLHAIH